MQQRFREYKIWQWINGRKQCFHRLNNWMIVPQSPSGVAAENGLQSVLGR